MIPPDAKKIRKQVYLLQASDFIHHPIWEFCPDEESVEGQDEATVKPSVLSRVEDSLGGTYVIAAEALFADSTTHPAYIYSGPTEDLGCLQPNLLTPSAQVNLWFGSLRFRSNPEGYLNACYGLLDKPREAIFPVQFTSEVHVNGAPLRCVVDGFKATDHHDRVITIG